ncbi:MAG: GGDEF domain-containing protein [Myxococcales bacterium]|nr:GGDEF domain-containing protein [Myxococcales bacterium]
MFVDTLPEAHAWRVRVAHVPLSLAALLGRLPCRLRLSAELPADAEAIPASITPLLKLASQGVFEPGEVRVGATCSLTVVRDDGAGREGRRVVVDGVGLAIDARELVRRIVGELLDTALFTAALEGFAEGEARLATLRALTSEVLRAPDVDAAARVMISGIASGAGLGFHRVALFVSNADRELAGLHGVGPADEAEAHRIWESLESEGSALTLPESRRMRVEDGFAALVRDTTLSADGPLVREALAATSPVVVTPDASLAALDPGPWAVLARVRFDGGAALLFADDRFGTTTPPDEARRSALGLFVDTLSLARDNRALLSRVEALASTDPLTTLATRRAFDERLAEEIARATRDRAPLSLILIDLDHFKAINDRLGHAEGDAVLRSVGGVVLANVRGHDFAARIGGDELAVLLPGAALSEGLLVARRLAASARAAGIALSLGLGASPEHGAPKDLFTVADRHLYVAKAVGRAAIGYGPTDVER